MIREYDVAIVGAGVGGLTAGIYGARSGLKTLVLEKAGIGGQILKTDIVENYPAFPQGISGYELTEKIRLQAEKFGVEFMNGEVTAIEKKADSMFKISVNDGEGCGARAVIIATGADPKTLNVKGEAQLTGKGVSYCATCDGPLFRNKEVAVVGGGDSAVGEAVYLARLAKKIILVHRRDRFRAAQALSDRILQNRNIEIRLNCVLTEIMGSERVSGIRIKDVKTREEREIPVSGVFIYVGVRPNTDFLKGFIGLTADGFIKTSESMETSVQGVYACGDVRENALKQVVVACSEGAIAAYSCINYIEKIGPNVPFSE